MQVEIADLRCALDKADEIKEKANEAYKQKEFRLYAMRLYHQAVLQIKGFVEKPNMAAMLGSPEEEKPVVNQVLQQSCCLHFEWTSPSTADYLRAVTYCDKVLASEPDNQKAIFRKGCAYKLAQKYEKAMEQFKQCPQNIQASALLEECRLKEKEEIRRGTPNCEPALLRKVFSNLTPDVFSNMP
uniref:Uncharacterized protein n=1 Tax=Ditylenchus dipsaci TaxID=166011 RepID=A0A915E2D0_9BILA